MIRTEYFIKPCDLQNRFILNNWGFDLHDLAGDMKGDINI